MLTIPARLIDHLIWADQQILSLLSVAPAAATADPNRLYSHLLAAERVWLLRLDGHDSSVQPIWPDLSYQDMAALATRNAADYRRLIADTSHDWSREVVYRNSVGATFTSSAIDILLHVALHGSHHRGQIATRLRQADVAPVNVDYIAFVRAQAAS